jgi:hypothetical protein
MKRRIKVKKTLKMKVTMNHLLTKADKAVTVMIVKVIIVLRKERKENKMMRMESGKNVVMLTSLIISSDLRYRKNLFKVA